MGILMATDAEGGIVTKNGLARCASLLFPLKKDAPNIPHLSGDNLGPYCSDWQAYDDGWQFEFSNGVYGCLAWNVDSVRGAIISILRHANRHGLKVTFADRVRVFKPDMTIAPSRAFVVGCNSTMSAERGGEEAPTFPDYLKFLNTDGILCGTHLHCNQNNIGKDWWQSDDQEREKFLNLVRSVVVYAVLPMAYWVRDPDCGLRYRALGVGNFRIKGYGIEFKDMGSSILRSPLFYSAACGMVRSCVVGWDRWYNGIKKTNEYEVPYELWQEACKVLRQDDCKGRTNLFKEVRKRLTIVAENDDDSSPFFSRDTLDGMDKCSQMIGPLEEEWHVGHNMDSHMIGLRTEITRHMKLEFRHQVDVEEA